MMMIVNVDQCRVFHHFYQVVADVYLSLSYALLD